jgi:hypothetical protein
MPLLLPPVGFVLGAGKLNMLRLALVVLLILWKRPM